MLKTFPAFPATLASMIMNGPSSFTRRYRTMRKYAPLQRHLAGPFIWPRPSSSNGSGRACLLIRNGIRANGLHVHELYLRALAECGVGAVASLDAKLSGRVVDRDDAVPLLDRQWRGSRDAKPHVLNLVAGAPT